MPAPTIDFTTDIGKLRSLLGDTDVNFPILSDAEYQYYLTDNEDSVRLASISAAKAIMFKLATQPDEVVGLFAIKGKGAAEAYREALKLVIKDATLNPIYGNTSAYASGISLTDAALYRTSDSPIKTFEF